MGGHLLAVLFVHASCSPFIKLNAGENSIGDTKITHGP